jgi:hypothetical protein
MAPLDCAGLREIAPELVLGVASGHERGDALAHLAGCSTCQEHVRELTAVADALLLLAPVAEPPLGFESRVLERVAPPRRRRRLPRFAFATAALAAAAAIALFAVVFLRGGGETLRTAQLRDRSGHDVGNVFVYDGQPAWMFVAMHDAPDDEYRIELQVTGGPVVRKSVPQLAGGKGSWGWSLRVDPDRLRVLRVVGDRGWRCAARFD